MYEASPLSVTYLKYITYVPKQSPGYTVMRYVLKQSLDYFMRDMF